MQKKKCVIYVFTHHVQHDQMCRRNVKLSDTQRLAMTRLCLASLDVPSPNLTKKNPKDVFLVHLLAQTLRSEFEYKCGY